MDAARTVGYLNTYLGTEPWTFSESPVILVAAEGYWPPADPQGGEARESHGAL